MFRTTERRERALIILCALLVTFLAAYVVWRAQQHRFDPGTVIKVRTINIPV